MYCSVWPRIFGADIVGYPDDSFHHPLSVLTVLILARKIMGLGVERLLEYHTYAKRRQAAALNVDYNFWEEMEEQKRESPIKEGELMEPMTVSGCGGVSCQALDIN